MDIRKLIINSTILFVVTAILQMTLRECGHFIAAYSFYTNPVMYHSYVNYDQKNVTLYNKLFFALAGSGMSLLIGAYSHLLLLGKLKNRFTILFFSYLAIFGYNSFFGYLAISPFLSYGVTGYVLQTMGLPVVFTSVIAVCSIVILFLLIRNIAIHLVSLMSKITSKDTGRRRWFITGLIVIPLILGIAITTLLNMPVKNPMSLVAPIVSPLTILLGMPHYLNSKAYKNRYDKEEQVASSFSVFWIIMLVVAIVLNRLLVFGFPYIV